jgi:hypothetical protein
MSEEAYEWAIIMLSVKSFNPYGTEDEISTRPERWVADPDEPVQTKHCSTST